MFQSPAVFVHLIFLETWNLDEKVMKATAAASPPHQSAAFRLCSLWVVAVQPRRPEETNQSLTGGQTSGKRRRCGASIDAQLRTHTFSEAFNYSALLLI